MMVVSKSHELIFTFIEHYRCISFFPSFNSFLIFHTCKMFIFVSCIFTSILKCICTSYFLLYKLYSSLDLYYQSLNMETKKERKRTWWFWKKSLRNLWKNSDGGNQTVYELGFFFFNFWTIFKKSFFKVWCRNKKRFRFLLKKKKFKENCT